MVVLAMAAVVLQQLRVDVVVDLLSWFVWVSWLDLKPYWLPVAWPWRVDLVSALARSLSKSAVCYEIDLVGMKLPDSLRRLILV